MSKLKSMLTHINAELTEISSESSEDLYTRCFNEKLKTNLKHYFGFLDINSRKLDTKSSRRILKTATKIQKNLDKDYLKNSAKEEN